MATVLLNGQRDWRMERDQEGHRTYKVVHQVLADYTDGPANVIQTPGLPAIGSFWQFDNDIDIWAICYPNAKVTPRVRNEKNRYWEVEQTFSTKPLFRCQDESIEDPLLEPQKISGSFVKYTKEITRDRFGNYITSSSHEQFRGSQVEFDHNRPTVRIEQNVSDLDLGTVASLVDSVNSSPLWGLPARCIKLSNVSWERKLWGTCSYYYTRIFEFDIDYNTFDRSVLDEGTKVLNGHWDVADGTGGSGGWVLDNIDGSPPDKTNPAHFIRYKDRNGENARVILDGNGKPLENGANPATVSISYYPSANFLLLGIPTVF